MDNGIASRAVSSDKPPRIVSHLESRFVKDGDAVTLACRIIGAEQFDVVWLHNNKEIKPSKDFHYTREANIYKLEIAEIFPEDCGTYTCEAFNDAGESFSSCTINVIVAGEEVKSPTFESFPGEKTLYKWSREIIEHFMKNVKLTLLILYYRIPDCPGR